MRFNFFASSLTVALSAAVYMQAADVVTEHDDDTLMLAQVDSEGVWYANGKKKSSYLRPADNCCYIYMGLDYTDPVKEPLCWDNSEDAENKGTQKEYGDKKAKFVMGVDCGKNTWVELLQLSHKRS